MVERLTLAAGDAAAIAAQVRGMVPAPGSVADTVAAIIESVRTGGDHALREHEQRFAPAGEAVRLRVSDADLRAALDTLDPDVRAGLELARDNVGLVARAGLGEDRDVDLPQGQRIRLRELPVARAAVYAPGGRKPYPSSVVMGVVTARAAGVREIAVAAPAHAVILAACALCGADEVYRMGGAQAIAALALGTETIRPADVIVGPGNLYVQEAKRQLSGRVGIDGFAGPSDLLVIASARADPHLAALDLLAQAEHGDDSLVVAASDDAALLDSVERALEALGRDRSSVAAGPKVLVEAADLAAALEFSEALAPEHLQLVGEAAEALAPHVRRAGCVFVGAASATAFGDYVVGSNHTLPTAGAARFASGLNVGHFRRSMAEVHVGGAATALARAGVPIAAAEGFAVHAESMSARIRENR
ncbi:MAG: histidinol dehydrogenase [Solirubrobacterales bacterium]|nr:histidinol dehydrogenase [Solirubrobacterales bacterium]